MIHCIILCILYTKFQHQNDTVLYRVEAGEDLIVEVEDGSVAVVDHVELDQTKGMFFYLCVF